MKTLFRSVAVIGLLAAGSMALAQPPAGNRPPPPPPSLISYDQAATAMAAAEAHARDNGWAMSIRIVDQNGNLVMFHRMQDANPFTATIAERKTTTVLRMKMTSAEFGAKVQAGEVEDFENSAPFGGGVPLYLNGELAGAIAASGARPEEDEAVSRAGVEAIGGKTSM